MTDIVSEWRRHPLMRGGRAMLKNRLWSRLALLALQRLGKDNSVFPAAPAVLSDLASRQALTDGLYEIGDILLVASLVENGVIGRDCCLDIGAHFGNHTLAFSELFSEVIAFEPMPATFHLLSAAIAMNHAQNVTLASCALGAETRTVWLSRFEGGDLGGVSGLDYYREEQQPHGTVPVAMTSGDQWLAQHRPDITTGAARLTFVKADVEGLEIEVVRGLEKTLRNHQPVLMLECLGPSAYEAWAPVLRSFGYSHFHAPEAESPNSRMSRLLAPRTVRLKELNHAPEKAVNVFVSAKALI